MIAYFLDNGEGANAPSEASMEISRKAIIFVVCTPWVMINSARKCVPGGVVRIIQV